jgi:UDP-glucose 4-epimerase
MTCLITGGSGCVGSYLIRDLLQRGVKVVNFDFSPNNRIIEQVVSPSALAELVSVTGDVTDLPHLARTITEHKVDAIFHLASLQIPASNANPYVAERINIGGLLNVLEAARLLAVKKVIWSSSIAVFGTAGEYGDRSVANDAHHRPQSVYGACKSFGEYILNYYADTYGVNATGLRYTAIYGVGRELGRTSFTTEMIRKAARGEPYVVPFGDDLIDWQYVEDVSKVTLRVLDVARTKTRIFNTQGDVRPLVDGVNYLRQLEPNADLSVSPGTFGIAWNYETEATKTELGFTPEYSMERGIEETFNRYRAAALKSG